MREKRKRKIYKGREKKKSEQIKVEMKGKKER